MGDAAQDAYEAETGLGDDLYPKPRRFHTCSKCGRKFKKEVGLSDHMRDFHSETI